jgi:hypothetical protein
MAKTNKDKQCYTKHIGERQTIPWPKSRTPVFHINKSDHYDIAEILLKGALSAKPKPYNIK